MFMKPISIQCTRPRLILQLHELDSEIIRIRKALME
jgi:hypothetical protein